ncbi:MAG: ABC transporter ATP-binding protein [Anaerolineae bacterium]
MVGMSLNGDGAPLFDVDNVQFSYDGRQIALDGVSLQVEAGEKIAILGSNGSGKSTLLKLLDGLYFPNQGQVRYRGAPLTEAMFNDDESFSFAFRRNVSLVFQDTDVQLFSPTVWDEVAFAPLQLDLPDDDVRARVARALAALRIEHLAERTPHRLSGGEKRRVALASVLSLGPGVWLLDEPTTGLDPRSQSWLIDFILERSAAGETFITATHDLDIVSTIADRVYVFAETHKIVAEGTPADILSNRELLLACNLIHEHSHRHGEVVHSHPHAHDAHATHEHAT